MVLDPICLYLACEINMLRFKHLYAFRLYVQFPLQMLGIFLRAPSMHVTLSLCSMFLTTNVVHSPGHRVQILTVSQRGPLVGRSSRRDSLYNLLSFVA